MKTVLPTRLSKQPGKRHWSVPTLSVGNSLATVSFTMAAAAAAHAAPAALAAQAAWPAATAAAAAAEDDDPPPTLEVAMATAPRMLADQAGPAAAAERRDSVANCNLQRLNCDDRASLGKGNVRRRDGAPHLLGLPGDNRLRCRNVSLQLGVSVEHQLPVGIVRR